MWVTAEELLGEVADEIDQLNDRPDSTDRCLQALDRYLETRTATDRQALRAAYLAVPAHVRHYALRFTPTGHSPLPTRPLGRKFAARRLS
jgi:hypothetical protein